MFNHAATHEHEITGPRTYTAILGALVVLTVLTVAISRIDFGSMNTVVAIRSLPSRSHSWRSSSCTCATTSSTP